MPDYLQRAQAPLTSEQWAIIDQAAIRAAQSVLIGRRIMQLVGPFGAGVEVLPTDTVAGGALGQVDLFGEGEGDAIGIRQRRFLPLPLLYTDFWVHWRDLEASTQLGAYVTAGTELFQVSDPRRIQIEAAVPALDAQRILPGDHAVIELPGGGSLDAVVRSATPSLNVESRTATIVLQPSGAPPGLTQGQALRVRITPRTGLVSGIVLPEEAVQQIGGRYVVFVRVKAGFKAVPVTVGSRSGGRVQIVEGLQPGVMVAPAGAFALKSQLGAGEAEN